MARDHESARDGFIVRNVPEGTPPEVIKQLADHGRSQGLKEIDFPRANRSTGDMLVGGARQAAQGLTLGWADEAEAALRSRMGDVPYEQMRNQVRSETAQFREDYPKSSMALELGGAMAPALVTRGKVAPSLGRTTAYGVGAGGVAGAGYSENQNPFEVALDTGMGMATGGAISAGTYKALEGLGGIAGKAFDWVKGKFGARGSSVVQNEVLRMAEATGQTPDEIIAAVSRGEIMADNATLRDALRAFYAQGDDKLRDEINTILANRAESTRLEGVAALQKGLAPQAADSNMSRLFSMDDQAFQGALTKAYKDVLGDNPVEVPQMAPAMLEAINRLPNAMDAITMRYKAAGNLVPPFKVAENGAITWTRIPTLTDAEILRRTLDKEAGKLFRSGDGDIGSDLMGVERNIRSAIDSVSPELAATRSSWRRLEMNREAFKEGKSIFSKQSEDMQILVGKMSEDPASMKYLRMGFMSALNNKMTVGGRKSLASKLVDPETKEGKAFLAIFPPDAQKSVLERLTTSSKAQETSNRVLGGSPTASTLLRSEKVGANISPEDIAGAATGNPITMAKVAFRLIPKFEGMSPENQRKVVGILMQEDPYAVAKAFMDRDAKEALVNSVMRKAAVTIGATSTTQADALQGL